MYIHTYTHIIFSTASMELFFGYNEPNLRVINIVQSSAYVHMHLGGTVGFVCTYKYITSVYTPTTSRIAYF